MVKVSVLVAVYNAEKYLEKCLNSLLNQSLTNIEIICVNDGSTDSSLKILERYTKLDKRIIIINQENAGASSARNNGLNYANGEYVCLVDSDDFISEDCLEKSYNYAKEQLLDACIFNLIIYSEKSESIFFNKYRNYILKGKDAMILSLDWSIPGVGLYKTDIQKKIKYDTSNSNGDELSTRKFLLDSRLVGFSEGNYYYRFNENSITKKVSKKKYDFIKNKFLLKKFLKSENLYEAGKEKYNVSAYLELLNALIMLKKEKKYLSNLEEKEIRENINLLYNDLDLECIKKYFYNNKKYIKYIIIKYFKNLRSFVKIANTYALLKK